MPISQRFRIWLRVIALSFCAGLVATSRAGEPSIELTLLGPAKVGLHEKIEFAIRTQPVGANPYEAEIDIEFRSPSGKLFRLPAFHMQPYERRNAGGEDSLYPSGPSGFRARFAPQETGTYTCGALRTDAGGVTASPPLSFEAVASGRKGALRVSTVDPRYFEHADDTPFFAIGQDLAFIGEGQYMKLRKAEETFAKLAACGVNYLRIWACAEDWAMAIEARKSAWARSWTKTPPLVDLPADPSGKPLRAIQIGADKPFAVQPSQAVALKPKTRYLLTARVKTAAGASLTFELNRKPLGDAVRSHGQWTEVTRPFESEAEQWWLPPLELRAQGSPVQLSSLSLKEIGQEPELLWEADPNRPARGFYNQPDAFMLDCLVEAAGKHGIHLQLTIVTRDLYMEDLSNEKSEEYGRAIADVKRLLRYAVARWGWSPNVAGWEYFNEMDPGKPTDRAYREWGEYLESADPWRHLRSTSAWGPNPRDWAHPKLDVADLHWYLRPEWGELSKDSAAAVLDRAALLRSKAPQRPALLSEFGLADDKWGLSPFMKQDKDYLHFHDALWASSLSGLSGCALFWWWEQIDKDNAYGHYKPLATFLADVPFAQAGLAPAPSQASLGSLRVVALKGKEYVCLWIQDTRFTWSKVVVDKAVPVEVRDAIVTLEGPDAVYQVCWWDTYKGAEIRAEKTRSEGGTIKLTAPPFTRDVACKMKQVE